MSFSPSLNIVRLQELKLWQGSYDNLLQRSRTDPKSIDGNSREVISLEDIQSSLEGDSADSREWDRRKISPSKPFEQLLEEKLAEDTPVTVNPRPKRPFLKKGQGLARFRMGAARPVNTKNRHFGCRREVSQRSALTRAQKTPSFQRKSILKKTNPAYHQEVDLSPLTVPDFVKPRGTWKQVFESTEKSLGKTVEGLEEGQESLENYEEFRRSLGSEECRVLYVEGGDDGLFKTSSTKHVLETNTPGNVSPVDKEGSSRPIRSLSGLNKEIIHEIDEHAKKYFNTQSQLLSNDIPESLSRLESPIIPKHMGDRTLEELKLEKELRLFEVLEKKVENSSFCSTNTSVMSLLASTPQKINHNPTKNKSILEQERGDDGLFDISVTSVFPKCVQEKIREKLQEVSEKTDVLQQFLINLRQMGHNKRSRQGFNSESDTTVKRDEKNTSTNTSYSDENTRWSTASPSLTDNYTEFDSICQSESFKRVDAGVNTSFDNSKCDETVKEVEPCKECEELRSKYSETKIKLTDLKTENFKLITELRDIQKENDKLKKTMKKEVECCEEKLDKLQYELDIERKKSVKERAYFESYVKDAQNRPSKKEREEITQLKQELADVKELLKLKDTKSGATQARLRTQIKQQEKELSEMKITVEKLQKENAKLTASQKYARRPQEVKMLHEINKNLSKLTEETFKKQLNQSGNGDAVEKDTRRKSSFGKGENGDKENELDGKNNDNKDVQNNRINKDSPRLNGTALNETPPTDDGSSIVHQYETTFGSFSSPRNVSVATTLEKTEITLADGSIEITYNNGNRKTISPDGKNIKMKYFNGDIKETDLKEQIIKYHYAAADSWHIQYPDGTEVMEFKDGQKCTKFTDGRTEISYPDGSLRVIKPNGTEEQQFPDGRKALKNLQGEQIILLPNGQREIHTQDYKRREYPDGTIRTLHKDGTVETVYANGRVRLKDANGVLIMDTHHS